MTSLCDNDNSDCCTTTTTSDTEELYEISSLSSSIHSDDSTMHHNHQHNHDDSVEPNSRRKRQKKCDTRTIVSSDTHNNCMYTVSVVDDCLVTNSESTIITTTTTAATTAFVHSPIDLTTPQLITTAIDTVAVPTTTTGTPHAMILITPVPSPVTLCSSSSSSSTESMIPSVLHRVASQLFMEHDTLLLLERINDGSPIVSSSSSANHEEKKEDEIPHHHCDTIPMIGCDDDDTCQSSLTTKLRSRHSIVYRIILPLFIAAVVVVVVILSSSSSYSSVLLRQVPLSFTTRTRRQYSNTVGNNDANSVCVSGGGFSGFWFTLGRLQNSILEFAVTTESILPRKQRTKDYYCYSSGCLGVVAALSRYSMEDMWNMAYRIQLQWKSGQLHRYDVVTTFVDELLYGRADPSLLLLNNNDNTTNVRLDVNDLLSLNIITSVQSERWGWGWSGMLTTSIRTPQTVEELRTMLIQTTWIPLAIGNGMWYEDHMDGAFTTSQHPTCQYNVGLSLDWDLYTNVMNVNLGRDKVEQFWKKGLQYGL